MKIEKKEKPKNNTKRKKRRKYEGSTFSADKQAFFLSGEHATPAIIEHFADEMVEYIATHPNVMHLVKFQILKGVPPGTYDRWLQENEYLRMRSAFCRQIIGLRREEKMATCDPKTLSHTLHLYSKEWDKANKDKAALKEQAEGNKERDIKIVFEDYREKKEETETA